MSTTTRIDLDATRAYEVRPAGDAWGCWLLVEGYAPAFIRSYPTRQAAIDAAHYWAQAEQQTAARLAAA